METVFEQDKILEIDVFKPHEFNSVDGPFSINIPEINIEEFDRNFEKADENNDDLLDEDEFVTFCNNHMTEAKVKFCQQLTFSEYKLRQYYQYYNQLSPSFLGVSKEDI